MTAPGGTNVGTAYGKVRIDYESTGVARAVKDVEALQHTMVDAGKGAQAAAKQFDKAQGQITSAATAATKALEKGIKVTAPIQVVAGKVDLDTGSITKAVGNFKDIKRQPIQIATGVKLYPTKVDIDKGQITRTIESLSRNGTLSQKIKVKAPVDVEATDISLNTAAIESSLRGRGLERITLRAPITIDPSDITINQGALTNISQQVSGAVNRGAAQGGSSGGGGGGGGGLATAGLMAARLGGPAAAVAAPLAGIGLVLTKGFSRLQGLDSAAIKLKALGKSTEEVKQISDSALKSVEGTAFGLDEAFQTAANAINSGIKPGQQLDKFLSATANTAALAGVSMQDLGSQFSEAAVQGKLTGDILQSLYARNVPVLQLLADEYGVTQQKAQEMVSNSEVSFDRFINAMSKNGDAATKMGNTVGGSFDNLMASVSRIGAMLLAPLFGNADGDASTMAKAIQFLTGKLKEFEGWLKDNKSGIITFWEDAAKAGLLWGQHMTNIIGWVVEGIGKLIEGIGHVPSAFAGIADFFGAHGIADNLRGASDNMTQWGTTVFESGQKIHGFEQTLNKAWDSVEQWADGARDAAKQTGTLGSAMESATPPMIGLNEALEKLGLKADSVNESITGTVQQFNDLMDQLERKKAPEELRNALQKLRDEYDNGGRAAESYETALENMADQTIDASSKADALIDSLQKLGILPGGDALAEYNEQFEKMTSYARDLPDPLGKVGDALKNADGTINSGEANGRKLLDTIEEARKSLYTLASSGEVPAGEAFDRTAEGLRLVLKDYGLMGDQAESIINKYLAGGQGKAFFETQFSGKTPKEIVEEGFKDDPAKLNSIIELMNTKEDILNELLGGPGSVLKIPAQLDIQDPNKPQGWWGTPTPVGPTAPGMPAVPGAGMHWEHGKGWVKDEPKPGEGQPNTGPAEGHIEGRTVPSEPQLPFRPWDWIKDHLPTLGAGGVETTLTPTSLEGKSDDQIKSLLDQNPEIQKVLQDRVTAAEASGQSLAEAFAQGINEGDEQVRQAIINLARMAEGLGNSPAPWGPLSGSGWSKERGKVLTKAYAEGIVSEADTAKAAVSQMAGAATVPFGQQIETLIKDLTDISSFGKLALDFGKQLADIAFSGLGLINDLSGGRLFPKSYKVDKGFDSRRGSEAGPWNPTRNPVPGAPFGQTVPGGGAGQIPLVQNPDGTWTSSNPEWAKLIKRESGGIVNRQQEVIDSNTGGNEASGLFQIAKGTWASNGGTQFAPTAGEATAAQQAQIAAKIFGDQGVKPWGSREDEAALRAGLTGGGQPLSGLSGITSMPSPNHGGAINPNKFLIHTEEGNSPSAKALAEGMVGGGKSYNYLIDPNTGEVIQAVPAGTAAYSVGSPGNQSSINAVIAGSHADWSREEWLSHGSALSSLAQLTARDAGQFGIPLEQLVSGSTAGIGGHDWVSKNLGGTDHTDPGPNFPWQEFLGMVQGFAGGGSPSLPGGFNPVSFDDQLLSKVPSGSYSGEKDLARGLADCSSAVEDLVNMMDSRPTAGGNLTTMNADKWLSDRGFQPGFLPGAFNVGFNSGHMEATLPGGTKFNWGNQTSAENRGLTGAAGADDPQFTSQYHRAVAGLPPGTPGSETNPLNVTNPNFGALDQLPQGLSEFTELLNKPKTAEEAERWLQGIDSRIADLGKQPESPLQKSQLDALGQQRSSVMSQFGLKEGPSALDQAQTVVNGIAGIASSAFETFDAGIKYIGAWKDVGDTLVRGIANTGDVMKLIDDWQVGLDFWNKVVQTGSEIASFAGQFTGGADMGATSAVGGALGMISQIMTAINTGIDLAQEGYKITTKYIGRFLTSWFGFPGATDIKFLLDEVEGQLKIYTSENPQMKTTFNTLGRSLGKEYSGRPTPTNNFAIYQGPGQDPRDTMDDAMYTVRSSGVGAFGYAD